METDARTSQVILTHSSGVQFSLYLTPYEINRVNTDATFAEELTEKYYSLYQKGVIFGKTTETQEETQFVENDETQLGECDEPLRTHFTEDDEEMLISLVAARPPLYDMRLPLLERSRDIIRNLWEEIISELNVQITVDAVTKKWKSIRDSYIRARANIKKKIASGSSATEKLVAERIKNKHKHFISLQFLDDTLSTRRTSTNADEFTENQQESSRTSSESSTPTCSRSKEYDQQQADQSFLQAINNISKQKVANMSATRHFCERLADSLERLPRRVRNKLEIEFLQRVAQEEERYCTD